MESTIRGFTQRDAVSPLTRHVLGLGILLLTVVPAYLLSQANLSSDSEAVKMARDEAADTRVEITQIVEIEAHIREVAVRYDIPPILVAAIVEAESEFNPRAVSRRGAQGLMQLMPDTASSLRVSDSFDPYENIEGGVRHLRRLMDRYRGNLPLVLAAYNAGEQAVTVYRGVPPYRETRRYVSRILRRIGRPDLVPRYGHVSGLEHQAVLIPVANVHMEPAITFAVATQAATPTPPRSALAERQFLERQLHERQVVPPRVERSLSTPTAEPTASPWSTRNLGEAP
jgi:transglycosylase-like protein with SLT domain